MEKKQNWNKEDEVLNLRELMDVQGGMDKDDEKNECGLGCYNNGTIEIDPNETDHSHAEG